QFVLSPYPRLYEYAVVDICYHVRCRSAYHLGLPNVIGERHPLRHLLVRVGDDPVGKGEVDRGGVVGLLQRCINRGWGISNCYQVLGRCIGHHLLAVVIELRGGTISGHYHPQLVWSLESDLGLCRKSEGMTVAACALIEMYSVKFHRARGR